MHYTTNTPANRNMKSQINKMFLFVYVGLFLYFISRSVNKYFNRNTVMVSNLEAAETFQYPSVSICPTYTSKNGSIANFLFSNASLIDKKKKIFESIWNRSEVFYFVNHPDMFGMRFPCVTIHDGNDPGKPCSFPFK